MKKRFAAIVCLHLFAAGMLSTQLWAQKPARAGVADGRMTNADVIKLVKSGVGAPEIMEKIRRSQPGFDLSAKGLKRLRKAGVGDRVIEEMRHSQSAGSPPGGGGKGSAPCATAARGGEPASGREDFDRHPPSRFYDLIRLDESSTRRLPGAPSAGANQQPGLTKQMRVGSVMSVTPPLRISSHGKCFDLEHGYDEILGVVSEGARQVRLHFDSVALPRGAKLFVYSMRNPDEIYGPYEGRGPDGDGAFWTPPVEGDGAVVEYYTPHSASGPKIRRATFQITKVSHVY